ncbi:MAG: DUF4197 domain-containing protein [Deltaproteobacteria bacterium]|nr:DUF4197 domain-containing protein [Deltaproteobacteria bacterium]
MTRNPKRTTRGHRWLVVALASAWSAACAGSGVSMSDLLGAASGEGNVVSGLKQALEIGTRNAVDLTSRENGFLDNPLIRIELPGALDKMASGLRVVGFGAQVDELEVAMNRAAEQAAGEAAEVFWQGIRQMTFSDAVGILNGGDTAATDYFERTTRDTLRARFEPIVSRKMDEVGVVHSYDQLIGRYEAIPFTSKPSFNLRSYVTEKSLDGLFHILGEEERKIRNDPAARVTPLLQQVFGE